MLNVALPKGRLGNQVYDIFSKIGYDTEDFYNKSRKLIIENKEKDIRYFLVKPSDVAVYVERGAADIGVVGKDILAETDPDVYELLDLNIGVCRIAVAAPNGYTDNRDNPLRVATIFPNIAREYYDLKNREIEIISLKGSIELAPILNLSDVIVDIVETGSTLKENNLSVIEEIMPISARLIANKSSSKFKKEQIDEIVSKLQEVIKND